MGKMFSAAFEPKQENNWNYESKYEFVEYPKWVKLADGTAILVHDAEEERAAIGVEDTPLMDNLRDALMAEARALGLNPHHRTGEDKLRELIAEAKG